MEINQIVDFKSSKQIELPFKLIHLNVGREIEEQKEEGSAKREMEEKDCQKEKFKIQFDPDI